VKIKYLEGMKYVLSEDYECRTPILGVEIIDRWFRLLADGTLMIKAGFAWAERHGITTPTACPAVDPAFLAGCSAHATEKLAPFDAGYAWALENEIADPARCTGAGEAFRRGCGQYVDEAPSRETNRCAEAWPGRAKDFPGQGPGQ
jgi:hypothetical protein